MVSYNNSRRELAPSRREFKVRSFPESLARLFGQGKNRNRNTATGALRALRPVEPNGVLRALRLNYAKPKLLRKGRPKAAKRRLKKAVGLRGSGKGKVR